MDFICYNITMSNIVLSFRNYISQLNYKLLSYDKLKYEQDWGSIEHSHPYSEILFVIGGKGSFVNNGKIFSLKKGNIVITNPYISHTEVSLPPPQRTFGIYRHLVGGYLFCFRRLREYFYGQLCLRFYSLLAAS